jgi:hypothetical protein
LVSQLWIEPEDLDIDNLAEGELAPEAAKTASYILWALSGRKFSGVTTVTERYAREYYGGDVGMTAKNTQPHVTSNGVTNVRLDGLQRLHLRGRPVQRILSVKTPDGSTISPDSYYLTEHAILNFYDLEVPYDIEVTYTYGSPPPIAGKMAAKAFAKQLLLAWTGNDSCALPDRVTSVSRQGISYTVLDSQDFIEDLRTGIYLVDLFLKTANPDKARARARVFSPDVPRARRYTPKPLKLTPSAADINVGDSDVLVTFLLADINAEWLLGNSWTTEVVVRSWSGGRASSIPNAAVINSTDETLTVSLSRATVMGVIGTIDPGTWDLYVNQGGPITHVVAGNIKLARTL